MTSILLNNTFGNFSDFHELSATKFPTYQAFNSDLKQQVVLKIFPTISPNYTKYTNEKSYLQILSHPNVIKLIQAVDMAPAPSNTRMEEEEPISYLMLEHAENGDFLEVLKKCGRMPERLARTFFHQLVDALEYVHSQNVAHLDLKLENLLLDNDYRLRIADFDTSQRLDSSCVEGRGTKCYRAPEVKKGNCKDLRAADLFSIGVVLFTFLTGKMPFEESLGSSSLGPRYNMLQKNNDNFWMSHNLLMDEENFFSEDLQALINGLLAQDPQSRPLIDEIRSSAWYNGETIAEESYNEELRGYLWGESQN